MLREALQSEVFVKTEVTAIQQQNTSLRKGVRMLATATSARSAAYGILALYSLHVMMRVENETINHNSSLIERETSLKKDS
jgi:hypothetical protein